MYVSLLNWVSVAVQNQPLPQLRLMLFLMQRVLIMDSGVICFWMIHSICDWNKNDKSLLGSSFRISGRLPSEFRFWISELMVKAKIKLLECTIPNSLCVRNLKSNMSRCHLLILLFKFLPSLDGIPSIKIALKVILWKSKGKNGTQTWSVGNIFSCSYVIASSFLMSRDDGCLSLGCLVDALRPTSTTTSASSSSSSSTLSTSFSSCSSSTFALPRPLCPIKCSEDEVRKYKLVKSIAPSISSCYIVCYVILYKWYFGFLFSFVNPAESKWWKMILRRYEALTPGMSSTSFLDNFYRQYDFR